MGTQKFYLCEKTQKYDGAANDAVSFLINESLSDSALWKKFAMQFKEQLDGKNNGWRGEFWGKMMRGACFVYEYAKDPELYRVLTEAVKELMSAQEPDGRVSSFSRETEFNAWDLWCRKYVLLGSIYFYEICTDEAFKAEIVEFLKAHADYVIAHIGNGEGQKPINEASSAWYGLNSSSILEPMVKLYKLTGEKRYLDFASYIIDEGGALGINVFELALENKLLPYQYGVSKAYEMMSCFEGILEYYSVTGIEKYRKMAENFGRAVIDSEISVIGSSGCTHELFDHTKNRQTAKYEGIQQETCVTVTWMKYCAAMLKLTGESVYADQIEKSFYNAYLGALNTEHNFNSFVLENVNVITGKVTPSLVPFDSYSPLLPGIRGRGVGGMQIFSDTTYYGCCACIGSAGVGVYLNHAVLVSDGKIVLNFFDKGECSLTVDGKKLTLITETDYPRSGVIEITLKPEVKIDSDLLIRIPEWSKSFNLSTDRAYTLENGYAVIKGGFDREEKITLELDMSLQVTYPEKWDTDVIWTDMSGCTRWYAAKPMTVSHLPEDDYYVSLSRGPITLAADERCGKNPKTTYNIKDLDATPVCRLFDSKEIADGVPCLVKCELEGADGEKIILVDYASAGKDWKSVVAAWLPTK